MQKVEYFGRNSYWTLCIDCGKYIDNGIFSFSLSSNLPSPAQTQFYPIISVLQTLWSIDQCIVTLIVTYSIVYGNIYWYC